MASPQIENGYTKISNEIMDALALHRISGQEFQIVLFILRKTYGFNKKCDLISMGQIAKGTGINRPQVCKLLTKLYEKNILGVVQNDNTVIQKGNTPPNCLYFQKDWEKWQVLYKKITVVQNDNKGVVQKHTGGVVQNDTHKRKNTKDNIQKKYIVDFEELWKEYPNKDGRKLAERSFKSSVKTEEDLLNIKKALSNYLQSKNVKNGFIKNGSTWFNNWKDWIDFTGTASGEKDLSTMTADDIRDYKPGMTMKEYLHGK